jgi:hypothetical protein
MSPDAATEADPVLLTGIEAREDRSGPTSQVVASIPRLTLYCQDSHVRAKWQATFRMTTRTALGSYRLQFELE